MNNTHRYIINSLLPLLSVIPLLQGCQDNDDLGEGVPDRETMISLGKYLSARSGEASTGLDDAPEAQWFPVGTPYRLLAFSKPDKGVDDPDATALATTPRFNKVAWEGDTGGLRYINIAGKPDLWFGFTPVDGEAGGPTGRVSLDFYGFTYGEDAAHTADYIEIDGLTGETCPGSNSLKTLVRTETVTNGKLPDLLRGKLLNRSIDNVSGASSSPQSVIPFRHCFSQLQFMVAQQPDEDGVTPSFADLYVDRVEVTGTYMEGSVYLWDGKVKLSATYGDGIPNRGKRTLAMTKRDAVSINQTIIGEMPVFPSAGNAIAKGSDETIKEGGYEVGVDITIKSSEQAVIDNFLAKSGSTEKAVKKEDNYWYGVITVPKLTNSYTNNTLYFSPNTSYTLMISFQKDAVRIITVIPQVEEWIEGEGTEENPWQEQPLGQPQMFDNVVWSDRNLGADHFNPLVDYEGTIGYFYQAGRNIPYFPFNTTLYANKDYPDGPVPTPAGKRTNSLNGETSWKATVYKLYPMVDDVRLLNMIRQKSEPLVAGSNNENSLWLMYAWENPQMFIPETKPDGAYFDFVRGDVNRSGDGLPDEQDMKWCDGQQNQPVAGSWVVPTSSDFMSIFPSTPYAGNITFRKGGAFEYNNPMNWNGGGGMDTTTVKTLRVTVPYFVTTDSVNPPANKNEMYVKAWNTLKNHKDPGTYGGDYWYGPSTYTDIAEPDGDPEDGYASVYLISCTSDDRVTLSDDFDSTLRTRTWGTIYAIKRIYTPEAYRMRLRVLIDHEPTVKDESPGLYIEICRYRCNPDTKLDEKNYKSFDWEHPAARLYFPICGLGDFTGAYINYGTECQYATRDRISNQRTSAVQIKISGHDDYNQYISVIKGVINRHFGMQIRPVGR